MLITCLRSRLWKASICPMVVFVVVQSSELLRKIGAMQALKILSFFLIDRGLFQMFCMVFMDSRVSIFLLLMSWLVSKSEPKYLQFFHSDVPFRVT